MERRSIETAVARARLAESRAMLERDTAAYFERLTARAAAEESRFGKALGRVADEVDFDRPS